MSLEQRQSLPRRHVPHADVFVRRACRDLHKKEQKRTGGQNKVKLKIRQEINRTQSNRIQTKIESEPTPTEPNRPNRTEPKEAKRVTERNEKKRNETNPSESTRITERVFTQNCVRFLAVNAKTD